MIDQAYQAEINKNLDAQQFGPKGPAAPLGTWENFGAGTGGLVAGPLQAGAAWSDILKGSGETLAATGAYSKGGMFATPDAEEQKQNEAAAAKIALQGPDTHSELGTELRMKAKDYMPDPQTTGKAGQILGGLTTFASQAIPAGMAGPPGLVALGAQRGVQKSAELEEQGVDQATRTAAGVVSGSLDAASMVLPMTGSSRLIAAGKGAVGGVVTSVAQTEAEKLILDHAGYKQLASTYDPFDPTSLALSAIVPAAFGGLHSPTAAKAPGGARAEPTHADVTLSPEEQAHSAQVEDSTIDVDMASLRQELGKQTDAGARQVLQAELDRLTERKAVLVDPAAQDAARVTQTAAAIDHSRLTPSDDLVGAEQHQRAVEMASDQIARGEPVEVSGTAFSSQTEPIAMQPVEVVRTRDGTLDVGATEAALPPVANGDVRLYRAESPTTTFSDVFSPDGLVGHRRPDVPGARYTTDLKVADYYRDAYNGKGDASIHYIDVPHEVAERSRIADDEFKVSLSRENMARAQAARVAELHQAVDQYRASIHPESEPAKPNHAAFEQARAEAEAGAPQPSKAPRETAQAAPEGAPERPGPEAAHLDAATAEILRTNPDLMVQLDGMEHPMRAEDLLNSVREAAAEETKEASLLEVAAQCAISL